MVNGLQNFCVYFYILALLLKRKEGRRKPDGTAYQPKIECSAPEKPLQQMTGVGQVNMIFLRFKPCLFFPPLLSLLPGGCGSAMKAVRRSKGRGFKEQIAREGRFFFYLFLLTGFLKFKPVLKQNCQLFLGLTGLARVANNNLLLLAPF